MIIGILPNGSAEKAGLKPMEQTRSGEIIFGDIIVGVDDKPIKSNNDLYLVLEKYAPGDKVEISYLRNEKREKASVFLTE